MPKTKCRFTFFFTISLLFFIIGVVPLQSTAQTFEQQQLQFERVREARKKVHNDLKTRFAQSRITFPPKEILIRIFKHEQIIELWVRNGNKYQLFKTYPVCKSSGTLGPKRKEGDKQVPEGFYYVNRFNPVSNYHLALQINYPNESDRMISNKRRPGGDIMIHGNCVTIGCIPMTDTYIREIYWLCVLAKSYFDRLIRVHIFPFRMETSTMSVFKILHPKNAELLSFWQNLKKGYDYFNKHKVPPVVSVNTNGAYIFR